MKQLLKEISYKLPNDGLTAFFDFYALNWMWFRIGSGHEEYYGGKLYPSESIPTLKRQQVINDVFDKCARDLAKGLIDYIKKASIVEFRHYRYYSEFSEFLESLYMNWPLFKHNEKNELIRKTYEEYFQKISKDLVIKLLKYPKLGMRDNIINALSESDQYREEGDSRKLDSLYPVIAERVKQAGITYEDLYHIFNDLEWHISYGGKLWSKALKLALDLEKKIDDILLKDLVAEIDKIYDLQHNTGSLLDKGKWWISKIMLDKRHDAKSIKEFYSYVSPVVQGLIISNKNYL